MTTDTALGVTKLVVRDGVPLDQIRYIVCQIAFGWLDDAVLTIIWKGYAHDSVQFQGVGGNAIQ